MNDTPNKNGLVELSMNAGTVKGVLVYDDEPSLRTALNAPRWRSVVADLDEWLRQSIKYGDESWPGADAVRAKIHELMADWCLTLDEEG